MAIRTWRDPICSLRTAPIITALAGFITICFFVSGFPLIGHDTYFHLNNLVQFHAAQHEGEILPRWAPNACYGFGSTVFYFYPPLLNFVSSFVSSFTQSYPWAIRFTSVLILVAMTAACSDYLRVLSGDGRFRWLASVAYSASPYAFFDNVVRGCYSEYLAMAFIPLVFSGIEHCVPATNATVRRSTLPGILRVTFGTTLLVLSSIPLSAVCLVAAPLYIGCRVYSNWKRILPILVGAILSITLLAFYALPIWEFRSLVHLQHVTLYKNNEPFRTSPLQMMLSGIVNIGNITDLLLFVLTVWLIIAWIKRWKHERTSLALAMIVLLTGMIALHIPWFAGPAADHIAPIRLIQFPCRTYSITMLALAVLIATAHSRSEHRLALSLSCSSAAVTLVIATIVGSISHIRTLTDFPIESRQRACAFEYVPATVPGEARSVMHYARTHDADPEICSIDPLLSNECISVRSTGPEVSYYNITLQRTHVVRLHKFFWPLWHFTTVRGKTINMWPDSNGILCAMLPKGNYPLQLRLERANIERFGWHISILVAIAITLLIVRALLAKLELKNPRSSSETGVGSQDKRTRSRSAWFRVRLPLI